MHPELKTETGEKCTQIGGFRSKGKSSRNRRGVGIEAFLGRTNPPT